MIVAVTEFKNFLDKISSNANFAEVIVPVRSGSNSHFSFKKISRDNIDDIVFNSFRTINPLKYFFYPVREKVYPVKNKNLNRVIVGIKACDLKAMSILDKALTNGNFVEPTYSKWRENTLIITSDCDDITETCHCNLVGGKPYAEEGFDLNLSSVNGSYKVTAGSERGREFFEMMKEEVKGREPSVEEDKTIKEKRKQIQIKLDEQNEKFNIGQDYDGFRSVKEEVWKEQSSSCVGCGACTNICPTCYCLILNDESKYKSEEFIKVRSYDSCQWTGYARVAGGGTPRPKVTQRFRNRYLCKFDYMRSNFGEIGCTGCGRCSEVCADFRKVIQNISIQAKQTV